MNGISFYKGFENIYKTNWQSKCYLGRLLMYISSLIPSLDFSTFCHEFLPGINPENHSEVPLGIATKLQFRNYQIMPSGDCFRKSIQGFLQKDFQKKTLKGSQTKLTPEGFPQRVPGSFQEEICPKKLQKWSMRKISIKTIFSEGNSEGF